MTGAFKARCFVVDVSGFMVENRSFYHPNAPFFPFVNIQEYLIILVVIC